ncbi:hypothetical protein ACJ5NV_09255 [Loktanella agnita]|uniref:hypothetical protein n=1 Tax=Loktanella agnita TaxID=287097 RepID=UPI003987B7B3
MVSGVRYLAVLLVLATPALGQSRAVDPSDLSLTVTMETIAETVVRQEMILLTIHGIYRRHITREELEQPDLEGFNWMQLGQDEWFDSMRDGLPVKNMRRRVAVFPDKTGRLKIGPFQHHVTLLDADNKWFEHTVESVPLSVDVAPEPATEGWWFPVRRLEISDTWSNAPDQLAEGEGVLRVVRVSALGASPDMIPPMPELTSPSALIFAHPEKRLVDLTPDGPRAIAFWRWTVTPTNGNAAILAPISFDYFDTVTREMRNVVISAQRIAFGAPLEHVLAAGPVDIVETAQRLRVLAGAGAAAFLAGFAMLFRKRRFSSAWLIGRFHRWRLLWQFSRAVRRHDKAGLRRAARELDALYAPSDTRRALLSQLESDLFGRRSHKWQAFDFGREFRKHLRKAQPA